MKRIFILLLTAASAFAQQGFDFKTLDKLGAKAAGSTNITLEGDTLALASSFLGDDDEGLKSLVKNLKGIYVRVYEFKRPGQYDPADLAPLRAYLKTLNWMKIVDVKEDDEMTEIYLQPLPNSQLGGLAIVSAEADEVTVVFIAGAMNLSDIGKLSGNFGIPSLPRITPNRSGEKSGSGKTSGNNKKD